MAQDLNPAPAPDRAAALDPAGQPVGSESPLFPRKLQAVFAVSIAATAIAAAALVVNLSFLRGSAEQLEHLRNTHDALEGLQSSLLDAETGQRGYLLTGRSEYLEPYLSAKQAYPATLAILDSAAGGDAVLQRSLAQLKVLIGDKMAIIDRTIERYGAAGDIVPSSAGKQAMDRIRDAIAGMRSHVAAQIASTNQLSERYTLITFIIAILAGAFDLLALVIVRGAVADEQRRRNLAEDELRDRAALMNAITDGTEDWIFVKDRFGKLLYANRAVGRAFDRDPEQLIGALPGGYVADPEEASTIHANDMRIMANASGERIEQTITSHGEKKTFISTKTPRLDTAGNVIGLIGIATDITERKKAEEITSTANQRLTTAVAEQTAQLTELSQHLISVAEEERRLLAAELHDELGALHTVITMDLGSLRKEIETALPDAAVRIDKVLALVDQARQVKRRIIADLRPVLLDDFGLIPALEHYVEPWSKSSGIKVVVDRKDGFPALSPDLALALFRVAQESLTNAAKYSGAREIRISLEHAASEVKLTVADDGIGIAPEALERSRSHGLTGMRQRVLNFGGRFDVGRPQGGVGTVVCASVPITRSDARQLAI
jgi:PAS domain S-box-containing protein